MQSQEQHTSPSPLPRQPDLRWLCLNRSVSWRKYHGRLPGVPVTTTPGPPPPASILSQRENSPETPYKANPSRDPQQVPRNRFVGQDLRKTISSFSSRRISRQARRLTSTSTLPGNPRGPSEIVQAAWRKAADALFRNSATHNAIWCYSAGGKHLHVGGNICIAFLRFRGGNCRARCAVSPKPDGWHPRYFSCRGEILLVAVSQGNFSDSPSTG